MVAQIIRENIDDHGGNSPSPSRDFQYDLGDGVDLQISPRSSFPNGLLWQTLQSIVEGLWTYIMDANRFCETKFQILVGPSGFEIGYGMINGTIVEDTNSA